MRLHAPDAAPRLKLADVYGDATIIGGARGMRTLLCFFRDASCPFCNTYIDRLAERYPRLADRGLEVIALFPSTADELRRFVLRERRPFRVIADPIRAAYDAYEIEYSLRCKLKAIITRVPTLLKGLRIVGMAGLNTNNIVPADFLIDEQGRIVQAYYGRDAGDHMPFDRIELFAGATGVRPAPARGAGHT